MGEDGLFAQAGVEAQAIDHILNVAVSILHLGQIRFDATFVDAIESVIVRDMQYLENAARFAGFRRRRTSRR